MPNAVRPENRRVSRSRLSGWFCFLAKRLAVRPFFLILVLILPLYGLSTAVFQPETRTIPAAVWCENPDPFTEEVIRRLLDTPDGRLYSFVRTASLEDAERGVLDGQYECAFVLPDHLSELLGENGDTVEIIVSSATTLSSLIREEVFGVMFEAYAPQVLASYIREAQDTDMDPDSLEDRCFAAWSAWAGSGETFHAEYEAVDPDFFSNRALFHIPLKGLAALLIFTAAMAGMAQFRHDRSAGRLLLRDEAAACLPALYCLLLTAAVCISALPGIALSGEGSGFFREIFHLILYAFMLTVFVCILNRLIRSDLAFDLLIPAILLFSLCYAPVFTDLSGYLPFYRYLTFLSPASWYLYMP